LLAVGFIKPIEETIWLSPIVVMPKKNGKLKIYVDFRKLNVVMKKYPYPLPFINEVINIIARHEVYTFLDGFFGYHQISRALEDQYKTAFITDWGAFVWVAMLFGVKNGPPIY
jgi:nucleosome binding factor SPN SPT16 subunit